MIADFSTQEGEWMTGSFNAIDAKQVETDVTDWFKTAKKMVGAFAEEYPAISECAVKLRDTTDKFRRNLPIVVALATPALKQRHWDDLSTVLGLAEGEEIVPDDSLTLEELLNMGVANHIQSVQEISTWWCREEGGGGADADRRQRPSATEGCVRTPRLLSQRRDKRRHC